MLLLVAELLQNALLHALLVLLAPLLDFVLRLQRHTLALPLLRHHDRLLSAG